MKKSFILSLILILVGTSLAKAQGFYIGPKVGMNISTITKSTYSKARVRQNLGLFAGYRVSNILAFQAEVLYSWQGAKSTVNDEKTSLNYLKIPVLAKVFIVGGLNIEAGLSFNFLSTAKVKGTNEQGNDYNHSVKSGAKGFDLSIPVGLNYEFSRWFDIGVRYDISTVRVWEESNNKARNGNWSINLGFRF